MTTQSKRSLSLGRVVSAKKEAFAIQYGQKKRQRRKKGMIRMGRNEDKKKMAKYFIKKKKRMTRKIISLKESWRKEGLEARV